MTRSTWIGSPALMMSIWFATAPGSLGQAPATPPIRVGMIGLDTSHTVAFAKIFREAKPGETSVARLKLVAAYPGGSSDIPSSANRIAGYTKELRDSGVEIVDSVEALLDRVDAVLITSLDGRTHLAQAIPVFQAGKPCFIDKPLAADLADALAVQMAAEKFQGRWFTSSSLRFTPTIWRYRQNTNRKILGAHAWSPCSLEPHHNDLAWYGIHGIEALYTAMGPGCRTVIRTFNAGSDVSVGTWEDGRVGVFRGIREGLQGYGLSVFGSDFIENDAKYEGYEPLVGQIADFLGGGNQPVANQESIEIMAFIEAAQISGRQGGIPVALDETMAKAKVEAEKRLQVHLSKNSKQ
jgi:hypothetical protein